MDDFDLADEVEQAAAAMLSATGPTNASSAASSVGGDSPRRKGGGAAKAKAKSVGQAAQSRSCPVCSAPKTTKQRFCPDHRRAYEGMRHQAVKDGRAQDFDRIMADPMQCKEALEDICRDNPPGAR